jgi:alpha-tubulin suppressor-like RCC1 family protein
MLIYVLMISIISVMLPLIGDDGSLFSWGANSYGQLGNGQKSNVGLPTRVAIDLGRIVDIGAIHYGHISACETHTKVYMVRTEGNHFQSDLME